jgi:hypothetical protein
MSTVRLAGRAAVRLCVTSHRSRDLHIEDVVAALDRARAETALVPAAL